MAKIVLYSILINLILQALQIFDQDCDVFDVKEHVIHHSFLVAKLPNRKLVVSDIFLAALLAKLFLIIWVRLRELRFVRFLKRAESLFLRRVRIA